MQAIARYFPEFADGTSQANRFVCGVTRYGLAAAAYASNPDPTRLYLAGVWATSEGPEIGVPDGQGGIHWLPAADEYLK